MGIGYVFTILYCANHKICTPLFDKPCTPHQEEKVKFQPCSETKWFRRIGSSAERVRFSDFCKAAPRAPNNSLHKIAEHPRPTAHWEPLRTAELWSRSPPAVVL